MNRSARLQTCCGGKCYGPGQVRVDEHQAVVGALVAAGCISVHYVQLPAQVIPVLLPAVVCFQPAHTSGEVRPLIISHSHSDTLERRTDEDL